MCQTPYKAKAQSKLSETYYLQFADEESEIEVKY